MRQRTSMRIALAGLLVAALAVVGVVLPSTQAIADGTTGSISGVVTVASPDGDSSKNELVAGATVAAYVYDAQPPGDIINGGVKQVSSTVTDAQGHYELPTLPLGEIFLNFTSDNAFGRQTSQWYGAGDGGLVGIESQVGGELYLSSSDPDGVANEVLAVPASISGTIGCSACVIPDSADLSVVLVRHGWDISYGVGNVHPDAQGHYAFDDVLPWSISGGYSIVVLYRGTQHLSATTNSPETVVGAGQAVTQNVTILPHDPPITTPVGVSTDGSSIRGTVGYADTSLHRASAAQGVVVTASLQDAQSALTVVQTATTDDQGEYVFDGLSRGRYLLTFAYTAPNGQKSTASLGWSTYGQNVDPIDLPAGTLSIADQQLEYTGSVMGSVTCEQCTQPLDPSLVTVRLMKNFDPMYGPTEVAETHPAADGSYSFGNVYPQSDLSITVSCNCGTTYATSASAGRFDMSEEGSVTQNIGIPIVLPNYIGSPVYVASAMTYALYWDFLRRQPSYDDVSYRVRQMGDDPNSAVVTSGFVDSDEYRLDRIDAAYESILKRAAEPGGRSSWLDAMRRGTLTTDDIETSLYSSAEYFQLSGGTNTDFVKSLYANLLHRVGSASDYAFWSNLVQQHGRAWVIAQYWDSTETIGERVSAMYELYLGRTPDPAGLASWVQVALSIGDSGLRGGLTGSAEYLARALSRYVLNASGF